MGGTNYSTTLGSFIGTGEFTLSAWVRPGNINGNNVIFKQGDIEIKYDSYNWFAYYCESSGLSVNDWRLDPKIGQWSLVTLVRDLSNSQPKVKFYIDGNQVWSNFVSGTNCANFDDLFIGSESSSSDFLSGTLADIFVFDTALNSSEINDYYQAKIGPRIHFSMNEDSGLPVDISGNNVHATSVFGCPTYRIDGFMDFSIQFGDQPSLSHKF